jgi:HSP20 family protein
MADSESTHERRNLLSKLREHPLVALREELDDFVTRLTGGDESWMPGRISAATDVSETDAEVQVLLDLPGVKKDEIEVHLRGNTLTVSGQRQEDREEKGRTFHRVERRVGSFSRSITLPCDVEEARVAAKYSDGVLTITLPKCEDAKRRKIEVKADEPKESWPQTPGA